MAHPVKPARRRRYRWLLAAPLVILLALGLLSWQAGRLALERAAALMTWNDQPVKIESGLILALPLVNLVYARDLTFSAQGEDGPIQIGLARLWAREVAGEGGRAWRIETSGLAAAGDHRKAAIGHFLTRVVFDRERRRLTLNDLELRQVALEGRIRAAFDSLTMPLAFWETPPEARGPNRRLLDRNFELRDVAVDNFKLIRPAGGEAAEAPGGKIRFSVRNDSGQWSLAWAGTGSAASGSDPSTKTEGLTGFLVNQARARFEKLKAELRAWQLDLNIEGAWAEAGTAGARPVEVRGRLDLPRLFAMTFIGESPAPAKEDLRSWAGDCLSRKLTEEDSRPCIQGLGFDKLSVEYRDQGLQSNMALIRPLVARIMESGFEPEAATDNFGPARLGLVLALWLDRQEFGPGTAGTFTFQSDGRIYPFSAKFPAELREGTIEVKFTPDRPPAPQD